MKHAMGLAVVVFVGIVAWRVGENLSSEALSMAVGVLFGVLAGIPTALLVLIGGRRPEPMSDPQNQSQNQLQNQPQEQPQGGHRLPEQQMAYHPQQPPVIVVTPGQLPPANGGYGYPPAQQYSQPMLETRPSGMYDHEPGYGAVPEPGPRQFRVVGEREEWVDGF